MIIGFVVILGIAGFKVYNYGDDSGYSRGKAEALESKNAELVALNQDNEILQNKIDRVNRERQDEVTGVENVYKSKLNENRIAHDLALDQYGHTLRVLLNEAEGSRDDKDSRKREVIISFINGLDGTEGGKLAPETRRDLELLSINADKTAILLGLCQAVVKADRE